MVRVGSDRHVVVHVEAERACKGLRRVVLALIGEVLGALAEVGVEDALKAHLPLAGDLGSLVRGDTLHVRLQEREELVEVVERVAIERSGERHGILGADTVVLQHVVNVVCRSTLCELHVAVVADDLYGAVHVVLVGHEALAEVVGLARALEDLRLEVAQGRVGPAGT